MRFSSQLAGQRSVSNRLDAATYPWWMLCVVPPLLLAFSSWVIGFHAPYWVHADQDLVLAYHGLLLNEGMPQEYFDHPGYVYFLIIAEWYKLLHSLGLLSVHTLSELPRVADVNAYNAAWTELIQAGRALSILLCAGFTMTVATMARYFVDDKRVGFLAGLAFAFAVGMSAQARQMRTDLLSAWLVAGALALALAGARRRPGGDSLAMLVGAGLCASLAVICKIQAIFPVMGLPILILALGRTQNGRSVWTEGLEAWAAAIVFSASALLVVLPAIEIIQVGISSAGRSIYHYKSIGGGLSGYYQLFIAGWAGVSIILYAVLYRVRPAYALMAFVAVASGAALGVLTLELRWNEQNAIAVSNLVEHMHVFSTWRHGSEMASSGQVLSTSLLGQILLGAWRTIAIRTVVFHPDNIPQTIILEWFAIVISFVSWRRGDARTALRIALLLAMAWGLETMFSLRGFQRAYSAYTDPLVILAASLALAHSSLFVGGTRRRILIGVVAFYVAAAQVWPVVSSYRRGDPAKQCEWFPAYMPRLEGFPFCQP
jgi:hypothetical protein